MVAAIVPLKPTKVQTSFQQWQTIVRAKQLGASAGPLGLQVSQPDHWLRNRQPHCSAAPRYRAGKQTSNAKWQRCKCRVGMQRPLLLSPPEDHKLIFTPVSRGGKYQRSASLSHFHTPCREKSNILSLENLRSWIHWNVTQYFQSSWV